ncbi:MAG: hypothetical protein R6U89_04965 [Dehalococcoidia bacterium]
MNHLKISDKVIKNLATPLLLECFRLETQDEVSLTQLQGAIREKLLFRIPQGTLKTILKRASLKGYVRKGLISMKYFIPVVLMVLAVTIVSCNNHNSMLDYKPVNETVVSFKDFCIRSETTGLETIARGTIYVKGDKNDRNSTHVEIIAWVEVDPDDWGGVSFSIPWGWQVKSIVSSCTEHNDHDDPNKYISRWDTADRGSEWHQIVEIGRSHTFNSVAGDCNGSVIIELEAIPSESKASDLIAILVGVGSDERNGTKILHPDCKMVEVPLFPGS